MRLGKLLSIEICSLFPAGVLGAALLLNSLVQIFGNNLRTPLMVLGGIQFTTADSLFGSHSKPVRPTMCPRNGTLVLNKLHFVDLSCNPYSAMRFNTSYKLCSADSKSLPNTKMSSM